jgi:hypothetical protein
MKSIFIFLLTTMTTLTLYSQTMLKIAEEFADIYERVKEPSIINCRFSHQELLNWLEPYCKNKMFNVKPLGKSAEGRTISLYKYGTGKTSVFLWTQMHGDEPTATMAVLDIVRFFSQQPTHHLTKLINERLTILLIPMLNPDGAERFKRRNAQQIDINRDALSLRTPEARILKSVIDEYHPTYGFNLHDQDTRNTVGISTYVTAIGLLAPAFNYEKSDNEVRLRAKRAASIFTQTMNFFIKGHIAKYDDTFEPRAFGDNIQKWGTSVVLVESGGWKNDPEKMFIRKMNFIGLLTTLCTIADGSCQSADISLYEDLPFNTKYYFDIIIRNVNIKTNEIVPLIQADIGINLEEEYIRREQKTVSSYKIMDIGDLSIFGAYEYLDAEGMNFDSVSIAPNKVFNSKILEILRNRKK